MLKTEEFFADIKRDLFYKATILITVVFISLLLIIYFSLNQYKKHQLNDLKQTILNQQKSYSKEKINEALFLIDYENKNIIKNIKKLVKEKINEASFLVEYTKNKYKNKQKSFIINKIVNVLKGYRFFNKRGYYFIYDYKTNIILSHPRKEFVGRDMTHFKDKKNQVLVELYKKVTDNKSNGGFAWIYFKKPFLKDNKVYPKLVYVKKFPEFNIAIGTGEYLDQIAQIIQNKILNILDKQRFGKNGYYWVLDSNYKLLAHPFDKKNIGKSIKQLTDIKGNKFIELFVNEAKKAYPKGVFVEYYWYKPNTKIMIKKISYLKYYKKWDWIIGTGVYIDDIERLIKKEAKELNGYFTNIFYKILFVFIIIYIVYILNAISVNKKIKDKITEYINKLKNINNELEQKVKERTKELQELNQELENKVKKAIEENREKELQLLEQSKLAQLGELIENIAHQWRQPLSIISTIATGIDLKLELNMLKEDELKKNMQILNDTVQHLSQTIGNRMSKALGYL